MNRDIKLPGQATCKCFPISSQEKDPRMNTVINHRPNKLDDINIRPKTTALPKLTIETVDRSKSIDFKKNIKKPVSKEEQYE